MPEPTVTIVGQNQPPASAGEGFSIDFGALKSKASELFDQAETAVPEPVAQAEPVKPVGQEPAEPAKKVDPPTAEAVAAAALEIADDQPVKILVDGEEQVLPWKDARGKISGGLKFTKNMQDLAKQREEFTTERQTLTQLQTERQQLESFLANKDAVLHYLQTRFGAAPEPQAVVAPGDPNEIATVGQARSIAEQQVQQLRQVIDEVKASAEKRVTEATHEIEFRQQAAKHAAVIQSTLTDIFTKNPVLKAIPDAEDILRYNVSKMKPQTEEDALAAFRQVAQGLVDELGKHFQADKKIQAVTAAKQKLESKSIEPAAGAAPQLQPTNFKNADGTVNWKAISQSAAALLG